MTTITKVFLIFLGVVVLGVTGGGEILDAGDWVLGVSNRQILWIAGLWKL